MYFVKSFDNLNFICKLVEFILPPLKSTKKNKIIKKRQVKVEKFVPPTNNIKEANNEISLSFKFNFLRVVI